MAKEFKTIDQLVELMESRGIITDNKTAVAIKRESYYVIVNGYKAPFLDREAMQPSADDVYLEGTTFQPRRAVPSPSHVEKGIPGKRLLHKVYGNAQAALHCLDTCRAFGSETSFSSAVTTLSERSFYPNRLYREGLPSVPLSSRS